jgi:hypothetical protein
MGDSLFYISELAVFTVACTCKLLNCICELDDYEIWICWNTPLRDSCDTRRSDIIRGCHLAQDGRNSHMQLKGVAHGEVETKIRQENGRPARTIVGKLRPLC